MPFERSSTSSHTEILELLQQKRLVLILRIICVSFVAVAIANFWRGNDLIGWQSLLTASLLMIAYLWSHLGYVRLATTIMLNLLLVMLTIMMGSDEGLFDEAPMAFPALLIFAALFGSQRALLLMLVGMLAAVLLVYVLHQTGVVQSVAAPLSPERPFTITIILASTSFFVGLIVNDLKSAVKKLEAERRALIESRARIKLMAQHDALTHLPNRALAKERLIYLLEHARRDHAQVAVIFLDLDNFKTINDSLGHAAGDQLLKHVAERLRAAVRASDTVARFSGDEFLILLDGMHSDEAIVTTVSKIIQSLSQPFRFDEMEVRATASIGIAISPRDGELPDELIKHADIAMYQAKECGRNAFRFFTSSMGEGVLEHLQLISDLRSALSQNALELHYQPQFELHSGKIIGAEALLRWAHPERGLISPDIFIPIAERSGLIVELGEWVIHRACQDAQIWKSQGLDSLTVAVNISPLEFRNGSVEKKVFGALTTSGLSADALELELTESVLATDNEHLDAVLKLLRAQGVQIAIDDFGTGYSNLSYLHRFAVHRLKIDKSFVRNICTSLHDEGIVRAIIEMAHCLGLEVVAEGVENAEILERLQKFGCKYGQGFYWLPAVAMPDFITFAEKWQSRMAV